MAWAGNTLDLEQVTADIHLVSCAGGEDEVRNDTGDPRVEQGAWAGASTGRFMRHPGHGDHRKMLVGALMLIAAVPKRQRGTG